MAFFKNVKGILRILVAMLGFLNGTIQSLKEVLSILEWHPGKKFSIGFFWGVCVLRITSLTTENKKKTLPSFESNYLKSI